jgi:hypothetical protein
MYPSMCARCKMPTPSPRARFAYTTTKNAHLSCHDFAICVCLCARHVVVGGGMVLKEFFSSPRTRKEHKELQAQLTAHNELWPSDPSLLVIVTAFIVFDSLIYCRWR